MSADLTILDVGHGNSTVVQHDGAAVVIDAGVGTHLLEYLQSQGIVHVRAIIISHADADHLKGLVAVLDQPGIVVDKVYVNSDAQKGSKVWKAVTYALEARHRSGALEFNVQLTEGCHIDVLDGVDIEVLAPRHLLAVTGPGSTLDGRTVTSNTISAVVMVRLGSTRVLLPADLDELGLDLILEPDLILEQGPDILDPGPDPEAYVPDLEAEVLVFPHHGGNVAAGSAPNRNQKFAERLLGAVRPSRVVFSIGRGSHQNPRLEIVAEVNKLPRQIMCTQISPHCCGELQLPTDHLAALPAAGRDGGACCAGSIRLTEKGTPQPADVVHIGFIDSHVPTPICRVGRVDAGAEPDESEE